MSAIVLVVALFGPVVCHAQDARPAVVTLQQQQRSRGETLTVAITNGPPSAEPDCWVALSRAGFALRLPAKYAAPSSGSVVGVVAVQLVVPPGAARGELPLGAYTLVVELDGRPYPASSRLDLVPVGNPVVQLDKFAPAWTDVMQRAFFQEASEVGARARRADVVSLVLRGSGFQTGEAVRDNRILIDGVPAALEWGSCERLDYGSEGRGVPRTIVAEAVGSDELRLCRVPVPPGHELHVQAGFGDWISKPQIYRVFCYGRPTVTLIAGVLALVLASIPLLLLRFVKNTYKISNASYRLRLLFLDQETDTYSLSKLQFYLWTVAALFSYGYFFVSRVLVQYAAWPDVPETLPGVIAVAAGTSIGSQVITAAKGPKGAGTARPSFADLITSGGVVAPDRLQMLLWTLIGVAAFVVTTVSQYPGTMTELPAVPERLLYLMGLSSVGYLGGKMARKPGPVINEIAVSPGVPDDALLAAPDSVDQEAPDLGPALANAAAWQASLGTTANKDAQAVVAAFSTAISDARSAQSSGDFAGLVERLAVLRTSAERDAEKLAKSYASAPDAEEQRLAEAAAVAQTAAGYLQELSADVTQAIAMSATPHMRALSDRAPSVRTITVRGTNLSVDAMLEIDHADMPFQMLSSTEGRHEPDVLARVSNEPAFARLLRLTVDPAHLDGAALDKLSGWFGAAGSHTFTLTNPDGQKAEIAFAMPAGESSKNGAG